jgi:hypothetical protein
MTPNAEKVALIIGRAAAVYFFADSEIYARECGERVLVALATEGYRLAPNDSSGTP